MTDKSHDLPPRTDPKAPASTREESSKVSERRLEAAGDAGERAEALRKMVLELLERVGKETPTPGG